VVSFYSFGETMMTTIPLMHAMCCAIKVSTYNAVLPEFVTNP